MTEASGSRGKKSTRKKASARGATSERKATPAGTSGSAPGSAPGSATARKKTTKKSSTKKRARSSKSDAASDSSAAAGSASRKMPRRTPEVGSNASGARHVQCYHCRHRFEVSVIAESTTCPECNQRVIVGDVIVDTLRPVARVQTCGRIVVREKARVNAQIVEAHEGLEMLGGLSGNVVSGGPVIIGPKAQWSGDCRAPSLEVHPGARIESGTFIIPDDSLGLSDLPLRERQESTRRASRR